MAKNLIFFGGSTEAGRVCAASLASLGLPVTEQPDTSVRYLLLDTPAFGTNGQLRGGGAVNELLNQLPRDILICGGNLTHPSLDGYETADFLKDERYLCKNAYITAECALDTALPYLKRTIRHCPVLIIGWGRIGKCLARILKALESDVTIAARNPGDRAMIRALGFTAVDMEELPLRLSHFRLLYNTVPSPVLDQNQLAHCREDCIKIELASRNGLAGEDIIIARGLPGLHMPESSGKLMADAFLRLCYGR